MKKPRRQKPKPPPTPAPTPTPAQGKPSLFRKIRQSWWARGFVVIGGLGGLGASFQMAAMVTDAYRQTVPDVRPKGVTVSSVILPFTVRNKSTLFDMREVKLHCSVLKAVWNNGDDPELTKRNWYPVVVGNNLGNESAQIGVNVLADKEINYPCDPEGTGIAGAALINGQAQKIKQLQVRVSVDYRTDVFGFDWKRHFDSPSFMWELTPDGYRLYEGEFIQ